MSWIFLCGIDDSFFPPQSIKYKINYNSQFWNSFLLLRVYISMLTFCLKIAREFWHIISELQVKKSLNCEQNKSDYYHFHKKNDVVNDVINLYRSLCTIQNCKIINKIKWVVYFSGDSKPVLIIITTIYLKWQEILVNELYKLKC